MRRCVDGLLRRCACAALAVTSVAGCPEVIVSQATFSNLSQPLGLKVDVVAHALYFVDGSTIRRSNLDGSGVVTVLSGLDGPVGLALAY